MLTSKAKYGLKALLHLTAHRDRAVQGAEIADEQRIPKKFLDAILLQLKNDGMLTSRKGKGGGYRLAQAPETIMSGRVVRLLDGPVAPIACASRTAYRRCEDCHDEAACGIRQVMLQVRDQIAAVLDSTSIADMHARQAAGGQYIPMYEI